MRCEMDGARMVGTEFHKPIRAPRSCAVPDERVRRGAKTCPEQSRRITPRAWSETIPFARSARPKRSLPLGAFPSLIVTRIAPVAPHRNYILITPARRFRHPSASLRTAHFGIVVFHSQRAFISRCACSGIGGRQRFPSLSLQLERGSSTSSRKCVSVQVSF